MPVFKIDDSVVEFEKNQTLTIQQIRSLNYKCILYVLLKGTKDDSLILTYWSVMYRMTTCLENRSLNLSHILGLNIERSVSMWSLYVFVESVMKSKFFVFMERNGFEENGSGKFRLGSELSIYIHFWICEIFSFSGFVWKEQL